MKISGIYKIESKLKPERIYIGSACNMSKRWGDHIAKLRRNKHHSIKLQSHYNKYGESDLMFSVLFVCEEDDLIKAEQLCLDNFKPYFNICKVAGSLLGFKHKIGEKRSPETCLHISRSHKGMNKQLLKGWIGRHHSDETKRKMSDSRIKWHKLRKTG